MALNDQVTLRRIVTMVRDAVNEPESDAKFPASRLARYHIPNAITAVHSRLQMDAGNPIVNTVEIEIKPNQRRYRLPSRAAKFTGVVQRAKTGEIYNEVLPRHDKHRGGYNWRLEGNELVLYEDPAATQTWEVDYVPSGRFLPHYTTNGILAGSLQAITMPTADNDMELGVFDWESDAYAGAVVRVYDSATNKAQTALVNTHDDTVLTLHRPLESPFSAGAITYEILPAVGLAFEEAVAYHVAVKIGASRRFSRSAQLDLQQQYRQAYKSAHDLLSNVQARRPKGYGGEDRARPVSMLEILNRRY